MTTWAGWLIKDAQTIYIEFCLLLFSLFFVLHNKDHKMLRIHFPPTPPDRNDVRKRLSGSMQKDVHYDRHLSLFGFWTMLQHKRSLACCKHLPLPLKRTRIQPSFAIPLQFSQRWSTLKRFKYFCLNAIFPLLLCSTEHSTSCLMSRSAVGLNVQFSVSTHKQTWLFKAAEHLLVIEECRCCQPALRPWLHMRPLFGEPIMNISICKAMSIKESASTAISSKMRG